MILETEAKQFIMIRVCGRASSSPHGGQKAEKKTERSQAERGREREKDEGLGTNVPFKAIFWLLQAGTSS